MLLFVILIINFVLLLVSSREMVLLLCGFFSVVLNVLFSRLLSIVVSLFEVMYCGFWCRCDSGLNFKYSFNFLVWLYFFSSNFVIIFG